MLRCSRCRQDKHESEFYRAEHRGSPKRRLYDYYCKSCRTTHKKQYPQDAGRIAVRYLVQLSEESQVEIANWLLRRSRAYDQAMFLEPRQYELTL